VTPAGSEDFAPPPGGRSGGRIVAVTLPATPSDGTTLLEMPTFSQRSATATFPIRTVAIGQRCPTHPVRVAAAATTKD